MTHSFCVSLHGLIDLMLSTVQAAAFKRVLSTPSTPALWTEDSNHLAGVLEKTPPNDKEYKKLVG